MSITPHGNRNRELRASLSGATGAYDHRGWSLFEHGDRHDPRIYRYVSIHESLHEDLSASTAYGLLLNGYAYLARHDVVQYGWVFESLMDRAKKTHEVYATYIGLLVFAEGRPDGILTSDDEYWRHLELARQLTDGVTSLYLQYHVLTALARVCMQPDWLIDVLSVGLVRFQPSELQSRDYPDERQEALRRVVTCGFWQAVFDEVMRTSRELHGWEVLQQECQGRVPSQLSLPKEYDPLSHHLMNAVYDALAVELKREGMSTLAFNGHQTYTRRLIAAVGELIPPHERIEPLPQAISSESDDELLIRSFERERLIVSGKRLPAMLTRLEDVPLRRRRELSSGANKDEHLFVVSRLQDQLMQQYEFSTATESSLRGAGTKPVMLLRGSDVVNGERRVELFVIRDDDDLDEFLAEFSGGMPLVTNLSLASMLAPEFGTGWVERLRRRGEVSVLFDRHPFFYLKNWAAMDRFDVLYSTIKAEVDGTVRFAFACYPQTEQSPIFLVPCSETLSGALNYYVQESVPVRNRFKNDSSFVEDAAWWLNLTLGHLFREEIVFECMANAVAGGGV